MLARKYKTTPPMTHITTFPLPKLSCFGKRIEIPRSISLALLVSNRMPSYWPSSLLSLNVYLKYAVCELQTVSSTINEPLARFTLLCTSIPPSSPISSEMTQTFLSSCHRFRVHSLSRVPSFLVEQLVSCALSIEGLDCRCNAKSRLYAK